MINKFLWFVISAAFFCGTANAQSDSLRISRALDRQDYRAILAEMGEIRQLPTSDPSLIRSYCRAVYEQDRAVDTCFSETVAHPDAVAFGKSLIRLWRGDIISARSNFLRMRNGDSSKWFGYIGLFDAASAAANYKELESRLAQFGDEREAVLEPVLREVRFYTALLHLQTGRLDTLGKQLATLSPTLFVNDPEWFRLKIRYLWATARILDIKQLLDAANANLGSGVEHQLSRSEYLILTSGKPAALRFLRDSLAKYPGRAELLAELGYSLLGVQNNNRNQVKGIVENLIAIKGDDLGFMLSIGVSLTSFQELELAEPVYRMIRTKQQLLPEFTAYYVLQAWNHVYAAPRVRIVVASI